MLDWTNTQGNPKFGEPPTCSGPDVKVLVLGSILIVAVEMEQEYMLHGGRPPYLNKPQLRGLCQTHDYLLLYLLKILAIIFPCFILFNCEECQALPPYQGRRKF